LSLKWLNICVKYKSGKKRKVSNPRSVTVVIPFFLYFTRKEGFWYHGPDLLSHAVYKWDMVLVE
jgi:hypothetical protein